MIYIVYTVLSYIPLQYTALQRQCTCPVILSGDSFDEVVTKLHQTMARKTWTWKLEVRHRAGCESDVKAVTLSVSQWREDKKLSPLQAL